MDDRIRRVCEYAEGPVVLDLGCVQHDPAKIDADDWLHAHLADRFEHVLGVDIHEDGIRAMWDRGYTATAADATALDLPIEADTVVAGELIEHVTDPGGLVASARDHLKPDGRFILTTPNPWAVVHLRRHLTGSYHINDDHVAWYGPTVLEQLLDRYGFDIEIMETTTRNHRGLTRIAQELGSDIFGGTTWVCVATPGGDT
jgi:2-polyprenyl-3-methyl-5-hydroxy-6-metoxy-1,4-benzoquinol methylase